jgi:hypothetical protein
MEKVTTQHGYTIGDTVYVKPDGSDVLKGTVVGFQFVDNKLPIIECNHPYKNGEKFKSAFYLDRISKTKTVTVTEWELVTKTYKFK